MDNLMRAAMQYKATGLSITAINHNKKSIHSWKKYQTTIMTDQELRQTFGDPAAIGIAIVCGKISGNLEVIDIDSKNDSTGCLFNHYINSVNTASLTLVARLVIATTMNRGYHIFYRSKEIDGNMILAKRPCTAIEKAVHPQQKTKILIETRGNRGYIIVHPTFGYQFIQNGISDIPTIEPSERQLLLNLARSHNQYQHSLSEIRRSPRCLIDPNSPFDDFNNRGDLVGLLVKHGWRVIKVVNNKTFFRRPGDTDHLTSGDFNHELGLFGVFTTSTEFEPRIGYRPYAVYAILECDGNFRLAAKRLLLEGYGVPYVKRNLPS